MTQNAIEIDAGPPASFLHLSVIPEKQEILLQQLPPEHMSRQIVQMISVLRNLSPRKGLVIKENVRPLKTDVIKILLLRNPLPYFFREKTENIIAEFLVRVHGRHGIVLSESKKYRPAAVESLPQALLFLDISSFATQRFYQSQYFFSVSRTAPTPAISSAKKEITLPASPTSSRSTPKICAFFRRGITFSAMAASE